MRSANREFGQAQRGTLGLNRVVPGVGGGRPWLDAAAGRIQQDRALPRLRATQRHLSADLAGRLLQGHRRDREPDHRHPQALHGQVSEVAGGMGGAATGDGQYHLRRRPAQASDERHQQPVKALQLGVDRRTGGEGLVKHF